MISHDGEEDDVLDEDAFEALFSQLEEDLKKDGLSFDSDDDLSEEDLAKLERELAEALGDEDIDMSEWNSDDIENDGNSEEDEGGDGDAYEDEDEDEREEDEDGEGELLKLKSWQIRRLARALKTGRRKVSVSICLLDYMTAKRDIKTLSAEHNFAGEHGKKIMSCRRVTVRRMIIYFLFVLFSYFECLVT